MISRSRWARWSSDAGSRSQRGAAPGPRAAAAGINVIDNVYLARPEREIVGRLIGSRRDRLILATKFSVPTDSADPNFGGTPRRTVIAACEAGLDLARSSIDYPRSPTSTALDPTTRRQRSGHRWPGVVTGRYLDRHRATTPGCLRGMPGARSTSLHGPTPPWPRSRTAQLGRVSA